MANTFGEKELRTDWNDPDNIGDQVNLVPENSVVPQRQKVGL